ncbi:metal-binding protein [Chamaesiphon sp. VAR_48_metabat_135_sub]|uniref:metal-binding protein n=1 Tax=Chamaesiphon sp. VAR_48_metabat_135_sub TaxID=2964699 RepID=UPI00286C8838|nr:metal-binding protein [Chamaesiphon sp. VAR_48_metabat_135_sub]
MPSGRTHDRVTLWSLPLIAGGTLFTTARADLAFWVSGGFLFSGLIFGPDLDLYSFHYQRWGKLRWLWRPYQKAIKHRSIWSHGPIIGTVGRILYLSLWLGLVGLFYLAINQLAGGQTYTGKQLLGMLKHSIESNFPVYLALFCGLELGAMSHYLSDWLVSTYKRSPFRNRGEHNSKLKVPSQSKRMPVKQTKRSRVK